LLRVGEIMSGNAGKIAYFSMEFGLKPWLKIYSGGLGVLAGDHLKEAADMKLPLVGVGLAYHRGYCTQNLAQDGWQTESFPLWNMERYMERLKPVVQVQIENRTVDVFAYKYEVKSPSGGTVPLILLSTNGERNADWDKELTQNLYAGESYNRIAQEVILGLGGVKMLQALGYDIITYHMNEGHAAFLTLELLNQLGSPAKVRDKCVFTTHTPVSAGHDRFSYDLANRVMTSQLPSNIKNLAGQDDLSMTVLAMNLSRYMNAVSKKHAEVTRNMFPGREIDYITNGIHTNTWTSDAFKMLYDLNIPGWRQDSRKLSATSEIPLEQIIAAHYIAKENLVELANRNGARFDPSLLTIGFARRFATYKRGALLFRDIQLLRELGKDKIQIVYAGKSHPKDTPGKSEIQKVISAMQKIDSGIPVVFIEDYDMDISKKMVGGVDIWLNTPERPREASGTSGEKAVANGVLNFSVQDGWVIESGVPNKKTGWPIGPPPVENDLVPVDDSVDATSLYDTLGNEIIPMFHSDPNAFAEMRRNAISMDASYFNTRRMVEDYMKKAYGIEAPK
jgi:glycogen phosphorylase